MEESTMQVQELTVQELQLAVLVQVMWEKHAQLVQELETLTQQSVRQQLEKEALAEQVKRGETEMDSLRQELLCAQEEKDSAKEAHDGWRGDLTEEETRKSKIINDINEVKQNVIRDKEQLAEQQETLKKTHIAKEEMDIAAGQCQEATKERDNWQRQNGNELNRMERLYENKDRIQRGEQMIGDCENAIGRIWDTVGKGEKTGEKRSMLLSD